MGRGQWVSLNALFKGAASELWFDHNLMPIENVPCLFTKKTELCLFKQWFPDHYGK